MVEVRKLVELDYRDFEIHIHNPAADGAFPVSIRVPSDDLRADGTFVVPFNEAEIARALTWLEQAPGDVGAVVAFGERLYRAVFTGQVARVFESARLAEGGPLRLRLILDSPLVARIPWELLYDPERLTFIALTLPLVRGASLVEPARQIQAHPPCASWSSMPFRQACRSCRTSGR